MSRFGANGSGGRSKGERLMSLYEAAKAAGMTRQAILAAIERRELRAVTTRQVIKLKKVRRADLETYLAQAPRRTPGGLKNPLD